MEVVFFLKEMSVFIVNYLGKWLIRGRKWESFVCWVGNEGCKVIVFIMGYNVLILWFGVSFIGNGLR